VNEYLRIILKDKNEKNFRKVLAMTFTNKAANEMKERIIQKLKELSKDPIKKTPEEISEGQKIADDFGVSLDVLTERASKSLNAILHNYGMFSVMTIDKFTHKVIRTFAKELGLSLDFDVELDLTSLRKNVTDLLFDQIGRQKELTDLMVSYANSNLKDDKSWNFKKQLFEFSSALFKEDAIDAINRLKGYDSKRFIEVRKEVSEEQKVLERKVKKIADDALEFIKINGLEMGDFHYTNTSVFGLFTKFSSKKLSAIRADDGPSNRHREHIAEGIQGNKKSPNKDLVESFSNDLGQFGQQILDFWQDEYPSYILNKEILKNLSNLSLMNHILTFTEEVKKEDNILLISDFYKEIAKLIAEEPVPFIYERLGVRYDHFLLDEFQDTSHLQWLNLIPLLHNSLASKQTNLIVGDGKQAIYRWRNGEVDQFVNLPDQLPDADTIESIAEAQQKFSDEGEVNTLKHNYRSAPEIVAFNNAFFEYLAASNSEYVQRIYRDGSQLAKKDFKGYLEFNLQEGLDEDEQNNYCLEVVKKSLEQGYKLNDISILVRRNSTGSVIAKFLSENGIKVISQDSLWVNKDAHVKFLVALLSAVTSQRNLNHQKKCVEHLSMIKSEIDPNSLWLELANGAVDIRKLFKKIDCNFSALEDFHSFYEYVEHLIAAFDIELDNNPYVQYFLEQVHQFEKKSSTNIRSFIQWFHEKGFKESVTSPAGTEAVQVMTFHKSKGLEFPIVICPFLDWDMSKNKSDLWMADDDHLVPSYSLTPSKNTLLTKHGDAMKAEDDKNILDHINMVYVAFTRAETALFISGDSKKASSPVVKWLKPFLDTDPTLTISKTSDDLDCMGEFVRKVGTDTELAEPFSFSIIKDKMDRTKFSLKGEHEVSFENLDDKRRYGTELHLVLSKIQAPNEIDDILMACLHKGLISPVNLPKLKSDLNRLFTSDHFTSYFNEKQFFNERIILDELGKMHIPDKIIYHDNEIVVVDYKTGEEDEEKHEKQVREYIQLMSEIEDKKVRGEIFYTESLRVRPVESE
jgi:ATP-dependent exoDNAse (exonuclease V) beta subunit